MGDIPPINFSVRDPEHRVSPLAQNAEMIWPEKSYAWFEFDGANGGTDACHVTLDDAREADWKEEIASRAPARRLAPLIRECLRNRRKWWFRRSAGQPSIVNLGYGYLAASLAELTDGFIYSDDGAWEWEKLPCSASDFYTFYFRPEHTTKKNFSEWSARNLEYLRNEGMHP